MEEKTPEALAQDAGSIAREGTELLRNTVSTGLDVARNVGGRLLEAVGVKKRSNATKRTMTAVRRSKPSTTAKRATRKAAKRTKAVAKAARKGATRSRGKKRAAKSRSR